MKKILLLLMVCWLTTTAGAQPNATDQLLWFKGKQIKPNVLLTPSGDTIFYNPQKREIKRVTKSGTGKLFDNMLAEISKTSSRIDQTIQEMSKSVPRYLQPDLTASITQAYTKVEKEMKPLLSNTYTLPAGDFIEMPTVRSGKGGPNGNFGEVSDPFDDLLEKIRGFIANHKDDNLESLLPIPPRYNFSYCFPCDSAAVQAYEIEKERFLAEIMAVDVPLHTEALRMCQYIQRKYLNELDKPEHAAIKNKHDEAWAFHEFVLQRGAKRAILLLDKYLNDPHRLVPVFQFVVSTDRQLQILGVRNETAFGNRNYWPEINNTWYNFYMSAFNEKDYSVGLNIRDIIAHERMAQLMGISNNTKNLFKELLKFNQFKLNSNITAKVSGNGGYVMGHVRGDNWFYAIPDKQTCRLNWVLAATTIDRTAKYKLLAAEASGGVEYRGTKDWQSQAPVFKLDFCDVGNEEKQDSILASTFHPEGFRELWLLPPPQGLIEVETISGVLMSSFIDKDRISAEMEAMRNEEMEKLTEDLKKKYTAAFSNANMSNMSALSQKAQEDMEKVKRELDEKLARINPFKYVFTPQVNNKDKQIFSDRLDGREIFPENTALEYAWFHLTLEHDPEGPHPLTIHSAGPIPAGK